LTRLLFAEPAALDLQQIIDYIALDNPNAAEAVHRAIADTARRLTDFPKMGRPGRLPDTREVPVPSLPYLIVYEVGAGAVTILAVFHGARDLSRALAARRAELEGRKKAVQ
jgi:toxin ParE1/3/4